MLQCFRRHWSGNITKLQAIRLIKDNLPKVADNPQDEAARSNLQLAATMAGWAFTVAQRVAVFASSAS